MDVILAGLNVDAEILPRYRELLGGPGRRWRTVPTPTGRSLAAELTALAERAT